MDWLKRNTGRTSYSTSGVGSSDHLTMELFKQRTGTDPVHVPYGGGAAAATDLIAGWWRSDRLFCVAVAFLALIFALATISGVILLLLRQPLSRYLIVAGAVVAILTYLGVFIAGARVAWVVHTLPILPVVSAVLTLLPRTREWLLED